MASPRESDSTAPNYKSPRELQYRSPAVAKHRPLFPIAMNVKQLADALGRNIQRRAIYDAIRAGELIAYRHGVHRVILVTDCIDWIRRTWRRS